MFRTYGTNFLGYFIFYQPLIPNEIDHDGFKHANCSVRSTTLVKIKKKQFCSIGAKDNVQVFRTYGTNFCKLFFYQPLIPNGIDFLSIVQNISTTKRLR